MKIRVLIREQFGKERIDPACEKSELFAKMIGQITLTRRDLEWIKKLGYTIEVVQPEVKI